MTGRIRGHVLAGGNRAGRAPMVVEVGINDERSDPEDRLGAVEVTTCTGLNPSCCLSLVWDGRWLLGREQDRAEQVGRATWRGFVSERAPQHPEHLVDHLGELVGAE